MKAYYEDNQTAIYHCDARDIITSIDGDVVLTDPPFGVGLSTSRPAKMQKHAGHGYQCFEDSEHYVEEVCVPIVMSCMARFTRTVITPGTRCMWFYPRPITVWAFHWPNGAGQGRWNGFNCWQPILCYGKAPSHVRGCRPDVFSTTEQAVRNGHPCPKPLGIWKKLMLRVASKDEVILDPFMGSGTTLRAAKDMGMRAIGIEIEERFCEIAATRLAQEVLRFD